MTEECRHGMVAADCSLCLHPEVRVNRPGFSVEAEFQTICTECREAIDVGDPITHVDGTWVHRRCS